MTHLLDRPVWNALTSGWAALAEGDGHALRLADDYGLFVASCDQSPESLDAMRRLLPDEGSLWRIEAELLPLLPGSRVEREALLAQMVADSLTAAPQPGFEIVELGDADAEAMFALARLTQPGPYNRCTHRLGGFIGVKLDGRLVAMAGERMRMPGFTEVSGVCTHPDHRGRGYAGALLRRVAQRILDRRETPFLHSYADNAGAIALYESLGFRQRRQVWCHLLSRSG